MGLKQLAFILVLIEACCCNGCWEDERLALLQLQTSFNFSTPYGFYINPLGSPWGKTGNCCDWRRIECDAHTGRVTHLDLYYARNWWDLGDWYLNASLFLPFKHLSYLDLSWNGITGCLQNEGFERLKILNHLEYLDLTANNFGNNILSSLTGLLTLKSLNIRFNRLKGSIYFEDFNNLKNLKELYLMGNEIEELIFFKGGKLRLNNLETLAMSYNRLNNNILSLLEDLAGLKNLYLGGNQLSGSFNVTMLAAWGNLELLDLGSNKNISEFVASKDVRTPTNLKILHLDDMAANGMSLLLKSLEAHFSNLKALSLQQNNFTESTFSYGSQSLKNVENLYLNYSVVDERFIHNLGVLPSLKSLSLRGCGLDNLQGLCNLNSLQSLDLSNSNLNGGLPPCLANLTSLQYLYLRENHLSSTLPPYLANLTSLQYLDLSYNSLVGNLSSFPFTLMTFIQHLSFYDNNFQIPISLVPFYNCSNLSYLGISGNELYAEIELHNLVPKFQLEEVYLPCDGCGGLLPRFLYHQHNLQTVDLSGNKMRGDFPHWLLENNTRLEILYLSNNSFMGTIKLPIHFHVNLSILDISSNSFNGQIPTNFGSYFPNLENLEMSNNRFNGSIPSSIGNLMQLWELDLSNNQLSGKVPKSLTINCLELWTLKLSNNSLQGHVFPENMNLNELAHIEMGGNQFIGTIPDSLYNCTRLSVLDFNNNHLSGEIPSWLGSMAMLEILDLSGNNIFGNIPTFWGASLLTEVYMSNNMLHGSFLHAFYNCSQLTTLDLSHNFLTEDLSTWIGGFPLLSFLLLGHNMLEGEISSKLCSLDRLSLIDLSNNNLSGPIPPCLMYTRNWYREHGEDSHPPNYFVQGPTSAVAPSYAGVPQAQPQQPVVITTKNISLFYKGMILTLYSGIDLSCNNLSGQIPPEFGNLNQIKTLNLSHNRLTGLIPATFSNLDQIESLDLSYNKLQGNIPPQLTQLPFISSFSVAHNNLTGRTPEMIKQFGTFNNGSYEGNPFLCGEPLSRNCTPKAPSAMPGPTPSNEEESGFIDMGILYVSFVVTYTIVLSGIAAILYINPYWRRAWFYFVERKMEDCYYFAVYDCPRFFKFRA